VITEQIELAGLIPGSVRVSARELSRFDRLTEGVLLREGDPGWDESVLIWNAMVTNRPALVLRPKSTSDIQTAISFTCEHGLLLSVKGGGHNIAGLAIAERGLMLDMADMREVTADPEARLVHASGGSLLGDVDRESQHHGLATVMGLVSEVGIAGLTLGGGFGYLSRRFGWSVDNLEEVEIVTADGQVRIANREQNADLFWAVRGGGGNFGVVTRFSYRLHEVGPTILGGLIAWPAERAGEVIEAFRELTDRAPRELTSILAILSAPPAPFIPEEWHGRLLAAVMVCHSGTEPERNLAPLRTLGRPVFDVVAPRPYVEQQQLMDDSEPKGLMQYWKSEFLPGLSDDFAAQFQETALRVEPGLSYSIAVHIGGALNERAADDGAVGNRDARFVGGYAAMWNPGEPGEQLVAWANDSWRTMRNFSTGGNYVNFQLAEDGSNRTAEAYRGNLARLRSVKHAYDPANLFRVNRNISPANSAREQVAAD
jgi:FAD/FMN-containing dehydrogenase